MTQICAHWRFFSLTNNNEWLTERTNERKRGMEFLGVGKEKPSEEFRKYIEQKRTNRIPMNFIQVSNKTSNRIKAKYNHVSTYLIHGWSVQFRSIIWNKLSFNVFKILFERIKFTIIILQIELFISAQLHCNPPYTR